MSRSQYKEPPLVKTYLGHALGTALPGALMPSGDKLGTLHALMQPLVGLIPNAVRITQRSTDPVFAQTFIGLSLVIAFAILVFYIVAMRGYHTRTFESAFRRWLVLAYVWLMVLFMLGVLWVAPYLDPLSKGRAHFLIGAAVSGPAGAVTAMNQLVVGMPLFGFLMLWLGHACTNVRPRVGQG